MLQLKIFNTDKLNNRKDFLEYYTQMTSQRREKIDRCRLEMDKKRSLGVGILIDEFLKEYNSDEKKSVYKVGKNGKPYFDDFYFNAAHSGNYAVCVFSDSEVGCDIEVLNGKNLRVARRFFSQNEQNYIFDGNSEIVSNERFVRIWTLRESYVKFLGDGLTKPLSSFCTEGLGVPGRECNELLLTTGQYIMSIDCDKTKKSRAAVIDSERPAGCVFYEYRIADAYISICTKTETEGFEPSYRH